MNHRQLKKLIKSVNTHVQTDQKWKSQQREVLLHAMKAQTTAVKQSGFGRKMALNLGAMVARPVGAFAMVLTVMFGSVIASVSAATSSTPGQILYPLKLTTERIQVSFVSDKKDKANLQLSFAKKRLQEIKDVVNNEPDQAKVQEKIKQPIENLKSTIASVKIAVEDMKTEDNNKAIDVVANLKDVANIAADVAAEPAVAKAVAATEAADQKIVDAKAVSDNADRTDADGADKTDGQITETEVPVVKDDSVGAVIKDLVADTVTTTKDAQASVIRELALKADKTQAKDEILKYIELLKKEREVKLPVAVAPMVAAPTAESVLQVETVPAEVKADAVPVETAPAEVKKEEVVMPTPETLKADTAIAEAQKVVDAAAVEDQKKFEEMVKQVIELLNKDDVLGAMKVLNIDVVPNVEIKSETNAENAETKSTDSADSALEPKTDGVTTSAVTNTNSNTTK